MSSPIAAIQAAYPVELEDGSVTWTEGILVICDNGEVHALDPSAEDPKQPWRTLPAVPGTTAGPAVVTPT